MGHVCILHTRTEDYVRRAFVRQYKERHEADMQATPQALRTPFDEAAATQKAEQHVSPGMYMVGWSFAPNTTLARYDKFPPISFTEACPMTVAVGGTLFTSVTVDANNNAVLEAHTWTWEKERTVTWNMHNDFLARTYADAWDVPERRIIFDGNKYCDASLSRDQGLGGLRNGSKFMCATSRLQHIQLAVDKAVYSDAVHAPTMAKLQEFKGRFSPVLHKFTAQVAGNPAGPRDHEQFMAAAKFLHGHSNAQVLAAVRASNQQATWLHAAAALLTLVGVSRDRFLEHQQAALRCTQAFPPCVDMWIQKNVDGEVDRCCTGVTLTEPDSDGLHRKGKVATLNSPALLQVDLTRDAAEPCTCGVPSVGPVRFCVHMAALTRQAGYTYTDVLDERFTANRWKQQYEGLDLQVRAAAWSRRNIYIYIYMYIL
jgi:hypothetical protein